MKLLSLGASRVLKVQEDLSVRYGISSQLKAMLSEEEVKELEKVYNQTVKKVTDDFEKLALHSYQPDDDI